MTHLCPSTRIAQLTKGAGDALCFYLVEQALEQERLIARAALRRLFAGTHGRIRRNLPTDNEPHDSGPGGRDAQTGACGARESDGPRLGRAVRPGGGAGFAAAGLGLPFRVGATGSTQPEARPGTSGRPRV